MIKNRLIIIPIEGDWDHSADFLRQTALTLSKDNKVIIYDQNNAKYFLKKIKKITYPKHKNIEFHQVEYLIPFRKFRLIEKINRQFSFWLFLKKYKKYKKILWIFYPNYFDLAKIKNKKLISIYDCVDYSDHHAKEKSLIKSVNYFFVNSLILHKLHKKQEKKPVYINAQGFFKEDKKHIKKVKHNKTTPIIGFVGGINYRLDFVLLNKLIKNNPQWIFILYGPKQKDSKNDVKYKTDFWINKIENYKNVIFGQSKKRHEVYDAINNFDVAIIPYNVNILFNKYCYPMKTFEYLYFGKQIVSTEIEELKLNKFKEFIKIAKTSKEIEKKIKDTLKNKLSTKEKKRARKMAIENSWEKKIEKILNLISTTK